MKAVLFEEVKKMSLIEVPKPVVESKDVLVKVKYCGICGTDTNGFLHGEEIRPGTIPGHETVGIVEAVGSGVEGITAGDRVAVGTPGSCVEQCYFCRAGRPNLCVNGFPRTLGIGPGTQGGYAEYVLAKYPNRQLIKIPDNVSFEDAVLFDIFATAYHGYKRSNVQVGATVAVVGAGAIGLSLIQILKLSGAGKIIVLDKAEKKLEIAKKYGADVVLNPQSEDNLNETIKKECNDLGPEAVFECVGNPATVGMAVEFCRAGGEVILLGTNGEPLHTLNEIQIILREIDIKGSFCYDDNEVGIVFDLMSKGMIQTEGMISKKFKLNAAQQALEELAKTSEPVRYILEP